jgi:putative ABC transport system permease protein
MQELFGIPMGTLATVLATALGVVVAILAAFALRNRVFFKLGVRNVGRRRARTILIVVGLMLGTTIIASALASGDTMSHTIRSASIEALGSTDEVVAVKGAEIDPFLPLGEVAGADYFDEALVPRVTRELLRTRFDGVTPAIIESIAVQDVTTRQSEPRVTLFAASGPGLAAFGPIRTTAGRVVSLDELGANEVYVDDDAAKELGARAGDRLQVLAGVLPTPMRVRDVVEFDGTGTSGPALLLPLATAQELLDREGQVRYLLISNVGDELGGAALTADVTDALAPTLSELGLELTPVKDDALAAADEQGAAFMSLFTTFGSFSIAAGILLIFLIFVMLAAERRGELGIARAIGTRRGHLVQMYVHEGMVYDLLAAAVGAVVGIGVALGMVVLLAQALDTEGIGVVYDVQLSSIVVAYAIGVLLTFAVVTLSAWRVSRMNIATAVRNLPEPPLRRHRRRRWLVGVALVLGGAGLTASGIGAGDATPFILGIALILCGAVPIARAAGIPERPAYTTAGLALVALCLLPFHWYDALARTELTMSFTVWVVSGLLLVIGSAWTMVYNADVLLGAVMAVAGRVRALAPVLRMAMAYPLRNRFRTGITLAMFTLVVFNLVVGGAVSGSFIRAFDDAETFGGGWDVRATASPVVPLGDPGEAVRNAAALNGSRYEATAAMSFLPTEARQLDTEQRFTSFPVRGVDDAYATRTTYPIGAHARGYPDPWRAVAREPGLAIVDSFAVARLDNFSGGAVLPEFQLEGFYLEDEVFDPVTVAVRDPKTGATVELKVVGVLTDSALYENVGGITTSQETLEAAFGDRARPTIFFFDLVDGVDAPNEARLLESAFLRNGLEADATVDLLDDAVAASKTFNRLIQGFMGLGLVVGVAALGVISARAVVERRQQIGILRAIGFRRRMIQLSFLLESSFVALTALVVGTGLALVISRNIVAEMSSQPSYEHVTLFVPWGDLAVVYAIVYAVALATTLVPAVRASRIYPAEALRYE